MIFHVQYNTVLYCPRGHAYFLETLEDCTRDKQTKLVHNELNEIRKINNECSCFYFKTACLEY